MVSGRKIIKLVLLMLATLFLVKPVFASTSDGTISVGDAWSAKIGWINFAATNGHAHITDTQLTGYVWSNLYGWIKLNPTNSGVKNNAEGVLSGSAWGENIGWVNFTGVTINGSGIFTGAATGDNTGIVNFSCLHCLVQTDWRPASSRAVAVGGGVTVPPGASSPPAPPYFIVLNNGALQTNTTTIIITLHGSADTSYAWVAEDPLFVNNATRVNFSPTSTEISIPFVLSSGQGQKTIYAKFCNQWGTCSDLISNSIIFSTAPSAPVVPPVTPPPISHPTTTIIGQVIGKVTTIIGNVLHAIFPVQLVPNQFAKLYSELQLWIPSWFKAPPIDNKIPIETFVAKQTPQSMRGIWNYLDPIPVDRFVFAPIPMAFRGGWVYLDPVPTNRFVFAPLPKEFLALEKNFPQVQSILQKVGVNRLTDLDKLKSVQMNLPGLTQAIAFHSPQIKTGQLSSGQAIPLGELPQNLKNKIPANVIFARAAGQLVDFRIALSLTAQNRPEQKISTVSGKSLQLTVRPDFPAKRITGYLVFRSKTPQARVEMPLANLINSLFFAEPAFAYTQDQPVPVEEKLVLLTFEYTDPDGDGVYTANIQSPVPAGEYEIITVIDYVDPELGSKQIRLITVVDPEGYVFEKVGDKELRIPNASVTLYRQNSAGNAYEVWPAKEFQQDNPQITDVRGSYSFLVTGGTYYIKVEAPGYAPYKGDPFTVDEGGGVHLNIELKSNNWWLKVLDWKTTLLILVAMLLLYNFYKDRRREKRAA